MKTKNVASHLGILLLVSLAFLSPADAAKSRGRNSSTNTKLTITGYSSAKLSRGTNSIVLSFFNLDKVGRTTYTLSYDANGISQGVVGSITPDGQITDARDLYFGTCSHGVCTPHYNITNASLVVTTSLKSGATNTKRYRIKV